MFIYHHAAVQRLMTSSPLSNLKEDPPPCSITGIRDWKTNTIDVCLNHGQHSQLILRWYCVCIQLITSAGRRKRRSSASVQPGTPEGQSLHSAVDKVVNIVPEYPMIGNLYILKVLILAINKVPSVWTRDVMLCVCRPALLRAAASEAACLWIYRSTFEPSGVQRPAFS